MTKLPSIRFNSIVARRNLRNFLLSLLLLASLRRDAGTALIAAHVFVNDGGGGSGSGGEPEFVTSAVHKCPCDFEVRVPVDTPALEVYAQPAVGDDHEALMRQKPYSRWRLRLPPQETYNAVRVDSTYRYHRVRVANFGRFALMVGIGESLNSRAGLMETVAITSSRDSSSTCPVLLPQHSPSLSRTSAARRVGKTSSTATSTARVVNGASANAEVANYLAFMTWPSSDGSSVCTGTLVSPDIVITAAHCDLPPDETTIYIGGTRGLPSDGVLRQIAQVHRHELFDLDDKNSVPYDIAWIRLSEPVLTGQEQVRYMKVNTNASIPLPLSAVRNAGYGLHDPDDLQSNPSRSLHQIDLPVADADVCTARWQERGFNVDSNYQICAGYPQGLCGAWYVKHFPSLSLSFFFQIKFNVGSCGTDFFFCIASDFSILRLCSKGDSGGPLFQYDENDEPVLIGVASIAVRCSTERFPAAYVRTSMFIDSFLPGSEIELTNSTTAIILPEEGLLWTIAETEDNNRTRIIVITCSVVGAVVVTALAAGIVALLYVRHSKNAADSSPPILPITGDSKLLQPSQNSLVGNTKSLPKQ